MEVQGEFGLCYIGYGRLRIFGGGGGVGLQICVVSLFLSNGLLNSYVRSLASEKGNQQRHIRVQLMLVRWATRNRKAQARNVIPLTLGYWTAFLSRPVNSIAFLLIYDSFHSRMPKGDGGENMFLPAYIRQGSKVSSICDL